MENKEFIENTIDWLGNTVGEDALLSAFFTKWPPERLVVTLQKRLKRIDKKQVRNALSRGLRREVIRALDKSKCVYCGKDLDMNRPQEFQVDHVVPYEKGGAMVVPNLVTSCEICNKRKGIKSYERKLDDINAERKNYLFEIFNEAWEITEGRTLLRKLFKLLNKYE